ncbi:hypothetical protein KEM55_003175, partial [Ascosphaera atra]
TGIGCRRDPLEANMWYVKAAEQGDERARKRLATIRQAVGGEPEKQQVKETTPKKDSKKGKRISSSKSLFLC